MAMLLWKIIVLSLQQEFARLPLGIAGA